MTSTQETARLLSIAETASRLGVSRHTLYRWVRDEGLPVVELRGMMRVPTRALDSWIAEQERRAMGDAP